MKYLLTALALTAVSGGAAADNIETGTVVWDAGIVSTDGVYNSQIDEIHLEFSRVEIDENGQVTHIGEPNTRRHILGNGRRNTTTFRNLNLQEGEYILKQVTFREDYQSFCLLEKTFMFEVESGKTHYLGQFQFNEPSTSPTLNATSYVLIYGMAFDLQAAQDSSQWRYGDAQALELESVSVEGELGHCGPSTVSVAAW